MSLNDRQVWARIYGAEPGSALGYSMEGALASLLRKRITDRSQVLEIGSGEGRVSAFLRRRAGFLVETDIVPANSWLGKPVSTKAGPGWFVQADCAQLPFKDETFAVVVASDLFSILSDPEAGIAEATRVLRPRGTLVANFQSIYDETLDAGSAVVSNGVWVSTPGPFPVRFFTRQAVLDVLKPYLEVLGLADYRRHDPPHLYYPWEHVHHYWLADAERRL